MNISPTEAADALREIAASADRAREFKGYRLAAPYFFLWGSIWILGYGASGVAPSLGIFWLPLSVLGMILSGVISYRQRTRPGSRAPHGPNGRRAGLSSVAFVVFMAATYAILPPHTTNQMNAFPALMVGMTYMLGGIWMYQRYLWLGLAIIASTLLGYFFLAPYFAFWMAIIGGGGLILTGFWMRKA
jgi:hypothetical protein